MNETYRPSSGDYAQAAAERTAQELRELKIQLAETFAKPMGWTPPIADIPDPEATIRGLLQLVARDSDLLARAYAADSIEEVREIISPTNDKEL